MWYGETVGDIRDRAMESGAALADRRSLHGQLGDVTGIGTETGECGDDVEVLAAAAGQRDLEAAILLDAFDHGAPLNRQKWGRRFGQIVRSLHYSLTLGKRIVRHVLTRPAVRRPHRPGNARRRLPPGQLFE